MHSGLTTCSSCPRSTFSGLSLPSLQLNSILRLVRYSWGGRREFKSETLSAITRNDSALAHMLPRVGIVRFQAPFFNFLRLTLLLP